MARAKTIRRQGTVERFSEISALLKAPGDFAFIVRGIPRSIVMLCPDGCSEVITLNLDRRTGPAWRTFEQGNSLTVYPSVWRASGCKAHFIIWNSRVLWCDARDTTDWEDRNLIQAVRQALPRAGAPHMHFDQIAARLGAIPWEVLWSCQILEHMGQAASSADGTKFGPASSPPTPTSIDFRV